MTELPFSLAWKIKPVPPYSFELTMRKPAGWPLFSNFEVYENEVIWTSTHIMGELAGIRISNEGMTERPKLSAEIFLQRKPPPQKARNLKRTLEHDIGADEDLGPFYSLAKGDGILRHAIRDLHGMHNTSQDTIFPDASLSILLQMAPLKRSDEMMDCYITNYGEEAEFDSKTIPAWPLPERIAHVGPEELASKCKLGYRAKRIVELARRIAEHGFPSIEELEHMDPDEAKRLLLDLPGIGSYSADIIDPHGGFPIDVWSADVFGLLFFGEEPKDKRKEIPRIKETGLKRWGKWSWMAFFYIVQDLGNLSRALDLELRME